MKLSYGDSNMRCVQKHFMTSISPQERQQNGQEAMRCFRCKYCTL